MDLYLYVCIFIYKYTLQMGKDKDISYEIKVPRSRKIAFTVSASKEFVQFGHGAEQNEENTYIA